MALNLIPDIEHIISEEDIAAQLGNSELIPCPFCGSFANSSGRKNQTTGIVVYSVRCSSLFCMASMIYSSRNEKKARDCVVRLWNNRT